ncbi:hypothetical protein [Sphingomonas sp. NFR15]|uniref:hypothetical protein n=1 Tax=Sphingomonas sp. NFR15 TaxID=1566282 RepID=UPI00087F293E|nr:hypothetical protein [Sphingomonas sp. NFR15]SDA10628.1 hypothetical protein SAMN03159340_00034 [Sphingomonas sp. NFR15]
MPTAHTKSPRPIAFTVAASADAQLLCRVLGFVARLGWVPDKVDAIRQGDEMRISIRLGDIDVDRAELLAENIRAMIDVEAVQLVLC